MGWLAKLFKAVRSSELKGIHLDLRQPNWKVTNSKAIAPFLLELVNIIPEDAIIYLEGGTPPAKLKTFLAQRCVPEVAHVEMGTIWPRPLVHHLPATRENILELANIAKRCATPEVAMHFHVYKNNEVLLQWHDAFCDDPLYISKDVPEEKIKQFCDRLGLTYESSIEAFRV
jgi:hypothetical protein